MIYLDEVSKRLDLSQAEKEQVMRELGSHYVETRDELIEAGMAESEADIEAGKRLGEPGDVAARLNASHNTASWKSAVMCAVPFVIGAGSYMLMALGVGSDAAWIACGSLLMALAFFSTRQLSLGRYSIWLPAWMGASVCAACAIVFQSSWLLGSSLEVSTKAATAILVLLFVIASCRVNQWRKLAIGLGFVCFLNYFCTWGSLAGYWAGQLSFLVLCVTAARATFELHRYGNPSQASLFLFSGIMLYPVLGPFISSYSWLSHTTADMIYMTAKSILYAVPVIWFIRSPSRLSKIFIALGALLLYPVIDMFSPAAGGPTLYRLGQELPESLWPFSMVVLPLLLHKIRKISGGRIVVQ